MLNRDPVRKIGGLLTLVALAASWSHAEDPELKEVTTFYLVRHAEKAGGGGDVPLREEGFHRAAELRDLLRNVPLAAVYSTELRRTRQTVGPITAASRLEPTPYPPAPPQSVREWTDQLLRDHGGESVLIVGHSGPPSSDYSLASIVRELARRPVAAIPETEYDNLFVVKIHKLEEDGQDRFERALERHRYGTLTRSESLVFEDVDALGNPFQVSAVAIAGDVLVVGVDEEDSIQIVEAVDGGQAYRPGKSFSLGGGGELDIEGLARDGDTFFVAGSHSRKRKKVEPGEVETLERSYKKNRKRLQADEVERENTRRHVYRFTFDPSTGEPPSDKESVDLSAVFEVDKVLKAFYFLPSKEQGIDIEGLAVDGEDLYLGLRGPVLRSGWVPVLRFELDKPEKYDLDFVNLGGRGIRDITRVGDGFLIIAGPVGDAPLSYQLYHWDGKDTIPGERDEDEPMPGRTILLGTIPTPAGAKAEGLAVRAEEPSHYEILVAYDGVENGGLTVFRAPRPAP